MVTAIPPNQVLERTLPFQAKATNETLGEFSGYAATWSKDLVDDRIKAGAFAATLADAAAKRKTRGGDVLFVVLWQHDINVPIGGLVKARETGKGLWVRGFLDLTTEYGRRAYSALKKGYLNSLSIKYFVRKHSWEAGGIRTLEALDLVEVSVVTFPANPEARVADVKSLDGDRLEATMQKLERVILKLRSQVEENEKMTNERDRSYRGPQLISIVRTREPLPDQIDPTADYQSRQEFERELRRELRESDPDLYNLTPGGKAFRKEIERRVQERQAKQQAQHEALLKERREQAERRAKWDRETFTPEVYSELTGIDLAWCCVLFKQYIECGLVTPIEESTLTLSRAGVQLISKRSAEQIEYQTIKARNKRAAERAAA